MKLYGLIGKKLGHSYSADFFSSKFKKEKIDAEYKLFPLPSIQDLPGLIKENTDLVGLNVTVPYKEEVLPYLTSLSEETRKIKAVNVIKISREKEEIILKGYNSDGYGFRQSLLPLLRPDIKKALILGTGGASKAVDYVLKNLGIKTTFVSRTPAPDRITYKDLDKKTIDENLLIVNTTPVGMFPDTGFYPDIPYQFLTPKHICYDLIYNPEETEFLRRAKEMGATIKNGLEMLRLQAERSWEIWNFE